TTSHSGQISYRGISSVTLDGGKFTNVYTVQSTAAGTPVLINTGSGSSNTVLVAVSTDLNSDVHIDGTASANTTLRVDNQAQQQANTYRSGPDGICIGDPVTVGYTNVQAVTLNGAASGIYNATSIPAGTAFRINPGPGPNTFNPAALALLAPGFNL